VDADAVEIRVLGCLIEKQRTTPDVYPLSLNALRGACNQSTNRDPVVEYDEPTIRAALERLDRKRWARLASGPGSRAIKYRHLLGDELSLDDAEISLLCVLMLRGPQTPGELLARTDRLYHFDGADALHAVLERLSERELTVRLERRPGQREERYAHLLGEEAPADAAPVAYTPAPAVPAPAAPAVDDDRLARLEQEVAELRAEVRLLREELGITTPEP
jgi:uncharacterized protein